MPKIIISYRRADSQAMAGRIFDRLVIRYGEAAVFMDIDAIPFGIDFRRHIGEALQQCDVLIALVGPHWLGQRDGASSRITDPTDPVRVELEGALQRRIPIIPVLIDGARMPAETELPQSLTQFSFFNAAPVDSGRDFRSHMDRLIKAVDTLVAPANAAGPVTGATPAKPAHASLRNTIIAVTALALAGVLAAMWWVHGRNISAGVQPPPNAQVIKLKASDQFLVKAFAEKLRQSNLNLDVELDSDAANTLIPAQWDAMVSGKLDLSAFHLHTARDKVPEFGATFLPGLVRNQERGRRLSNSAFMSQIKRKAVEQGVIILGGAWISMAVISKKRCIRRPEDAKGLNVFPASDSFGLMWRAAGAVLVEEPDFNRVNAFRTNAEAIETALVDAVNVSDLAKCTTLPGEHTVGLLYHAMLASKATFDRLNRDQQNALLQVGSEEEIALSDGYKRLDDYLVRMLGAAGVEMITLNEVDYRAWITLAQQTSYRDFIAKVPGGKQLIEDALAVK